MKKTAYPQNNKKGKPKIC